MSEKVKVKYNPPKGDATVCEFGGHTFYGGKDTELDSEADAALIEKMENHPHFEVAGGKKSDKKNDQSDASREQRPNLSAREAAGASTLGDHSAPGRTDPVKPGMPDADGGKPTNPGTQTTGNPPTGQPTRRGDT